MGDIEKIRSIAEELLDGSRPEPNAEEINGRFFFEVWDVDFVENVKSLSEQLNHDDKWAQEIKTLAIKYGLAESHVIDHVTSNYPLCFPQISITYDPQGVNDLEIPTGRMPLMVIQVFTNNTPLSAISNAITNHRRYFSPMIDNTEEQKRFRSQGYPLLVRTWTVLCLSQRVKMTQRQAITAWNEWGEDPELVYKLEDSGVTGPGEIQFSRDKEELIRDLLLTVNSN